MSDEASVVDWLIDEPLNPKYQDYQVNRFTFFLNPVNVPVVDDVRSCLDRGYL